MIYRLSYVTILSIFLVIVQTSVFSCFSSFFNHCYLSTTLMVFLSVHRPLKELREVVVVALISGFVMDTITGSIVGVYLSLHVWIVLMSKIMINYVQLHNRFSKFIIITTLIILVNFILALLEYSFLLRGELKSIFILQLQISKLILDIVCSTLVAVTFTIVFCTHNVKRKTRVITVNHKHNKRDLLH